MKWDQISGCPPNEKALESSTDETETKPKAMSRDHLERQLQHSNDQFSINSVNPLIEIKAVTQNLKKKETK